MAQTQRAQSEHPNTHTTKLGYRTLKNWGQTLCFTLTDHWLLCWWWMGLCKSSLVSLPWSSNTFIIKPLISTCPAPHNELYNDNQTCVTGSVPINNKARDTPTYKNKTMSEKPTHWASWKLFSFPTLSKPAAYSQKNWKMPWISVAAKIPWLCLNPILTCVTIRCLHITKTYMISATIPFSHLRHRNLAGSVHLLSCWIQSHSQS
jgi:hypothetical protein